MSEAFAELAARDEWAGLLEQTRQALSTLRAADLEELAIRAEKMLDTSTRISSRPPGDPQPSDLRNLSAEHRLLGSLLQATRRNLDVFQRSRGNAHSQDRAGEVNLRWVR
jgi:hypothetical protein